MAPAEGRRRLAGAFFIETDRIRPDSRQPRRKLETEAQEELAESVRQFGIMQPISVRYLESEQVYQIISGERRYHAAVAVGLAEVPCWIQSPRDDEILIRQVVENWQRRDLSPFELADALAAIRDARGYSQEELAKVTGKPKGEISKLLAFLTISPEAQKAARRDRSLTRRHLYALSTAQPQEHASLLTEMQSASLTAEEAEDLVRRSRPSPRGDRRGGAQKAFRRFPTSSAVVTVTFRKRSVVDGDIRLALEEALAQVAPSSNEIARGPKGVVEP